MLKVRMAVLVSGGGTNLQALMDAIDSGRIASGEIVLVVSNNKNAYALTRAKDRGIPAVCLKKSTFDDHLEALLQKYRVNLVVLAGFLAILSEEFTLRHKGRIINIHPALIPSFCGKGFYGLRVHEAVLARGVKVTGATVHYVNEIPDGGEIIRQKAVDVLPGDTPEILQRRVMEQAEWIILPESTEEVCQKILTEEGHHAN